VIDRLWRRYDAFWFPVRSPLDLGATRLVFYLSLFALFYRHDFSLWGEVDAVFAQPTVVLGLIAFDPLPPTWLQWLETVWRVALLASAVGLLTRLSTFVAFVLGFYLLALPHQFGRLEHTNGLIVILLGVLAFSRCGEGLSIDRLWLYRGKTARDAAYGWPLRCGQVALCLVFFAAGLAKLRYGGLAWVTSDTLASAIRKAQYDPAAARPLLGALGLWVAQQDWLMRLGTVGTIVVEAGYPIALFWRRSRWMILPGMVGLLIAIHLTMGPWFGTFIAAHVFWVPWSRWLGRGR